MTKTRVLALCVLLLPLAACRFGVPAGGQPQASVSLPAASSSPARNTQKSYVVRGKRYYVLASSQGFVERGVASWYGKKFHGRQTSNGEIYNMHAMTAAHKSLPLPTWVQVKNLDNGRVIKVRVNDRGPFVDDRIIDLSYAAANAIGMVNQGTAKVEIRALDSRNGTVSSSARVMPLQHLGTDEELFVQVAAFSDEDNARAVTERLRRDGLPSRLFRFERNGTDWYRVRVGPQQTVAGAESVLQQVQQLGFPGAQIVVD